MEHFISGSSSIFLWLVDYTRDISILICLIFLIKVIVGKKLPAWWHYCLWLVLLLRMVIPWEYTNLFNFSNFLTPSINDSLFKIVLFDKQEIMPMVPSDISSNGYHILLFSWVACAMVFGIYILFRNIRFWFTLKKEPFLTDNRILALVEECKIKMKLSSGPRILVTDKVKSPSLYGYFKPRLLMPNGVLEKLNDRELSFILMHELGHFKRHDVGVAWLMTFLQVIHWFNPLVWFAFYQLRIDQESACDEYVLSRIKQNNPNDYAKAIVGFLYKFCRNKRMPAMVGILENKSQIKRRVAMIVNYRKHSIKITTTAIIMLIISGFLFFTVTGFATEEQSKEHQYDSDGVTAQNSNDENINDDAENIIIEITKEGEIWIEDELYDKDSLQNRIELFRDDYPEGNVVIFADRETDLASMIFVLDRVMAAGNLKVVIAAKDEKEE